MIEQRLEAELGAAELVPASLEYADDQKMMEAMERIEGLDRTRRLEEKVLY
eukprot:COSAG03_NODE_3032_length_2276_cov_9.150207_2_plen_51_part_00